MSRNILGGRFPDIILGLIWLLPLLTFAAPTPFVPSFQPYIEKRATDLDEACAFDGDDNTYGLGIRIGVYLQWVTSAIAYGFLPGEAASLRAVNNCFQAAMFAGLLFITITKGSKLYAVEAYIMLIFCMGGVCSGDSKTDGGIFKPKRFAYHRASTLGGLIRFGLSAGFCGYGVWFFFTGMDGMQHPPCSTFAFFFSRVNLYNWLRTFMKVVFVLMAITHAVIILAPLIPMLFGSLGGGRRPTQSLSNIELDDEPNNREPDDGEPDDGEPDDGESKDGQLKNESPTSLVLLSGSLVAFILTVEFMIKWNHIQGVNDMGSTGQLLPLIVAVGGFFRVLHEYFRGGDA